MTQQHLYLVDGSSFIFRAYHRLPPLTDPQGMPVGAVYGFTAMLWKLIADLNKAEAPTHLAVVLDAGSHTFRNDMYDGYKANRPPAPEDLIPQFPLIREAARAFNVTVCELEGYEADDLIATYACRARDAGRAGVCPSMSCPSMSPSATGTIRWKAGMCAAGSTTADNPRCGSAFGR